MYQAMIEHRKRNFVNDKALISTVDIAMEELMCYIRCPASGQELKPFKVSNNYEGLKTFWAMILLYQRRYQLSEIIVGFESTGIYSEPLKNFMSDKAVKLVQINPMHTKKMKDITDNSAGQTDQKDTRVIADVIQLGHYLSLVIPTGASAQLRELSRAREQQMVHRTRLMNQLEVLMFKLFPEFVQIVRNLATKTARYLMRKYALPQRLKKVRLESLTARIKRISHGQLGADLAQRLYQASRVSLGTPEAHESILLELNYLLDQLTQTEQFIKAIETKMKTALAQIPYAANLLSVKGLGVVLLGGIIGEVGDFRRYSRQGDVIKLAGLDLYEMSSGKYHGLHRISKRGRWLLRKLLFFGALNLVRSDGLLHHYYQRLIGRGMQKMKALIAVMRKLLRIMFALVRDNTKYQKEVAPNSVPAAIPA
jgi:transposase